MLTCAAYIQVQMITAEHHALMAFDSCRAYHFGQNYIVELEVSS
jgi:hypothetical protein